jgi:hypothetical protein
VFISLSSSTIAISVHFIFYRTRILTTLHSNVDAMPFAYGEPVYYRENDYSPWTEGTYIRLYRKRMRLPTFTVRFFRFFVILSFTYCTIFVFKGGVIVSVFFQFSITYHIFFLEKSFATTDNRTSCPHRRRDRRFGRTLEMCL